MKINILLGEHAISAGGLGDKDLSSSEVKPLVSALDGGGVPWIFILVYGWKSNYIIIYFAVVKLF